MSWREFGLRAALVAGALAAALLDAPAAICATLFATTLLSTGELIARFAPSRDLLTRCLVAAMGVIILLILLGLLLNIAPAGLTVFVLGKVWR